MTSWRPCNSWPEGGQQQITHLVKIMCLQTEMWFKVETAQPDETPSKLKAEGCHPVMLGGSHTLQSKVAELGS